MTTKEENQKDSSNWWVWIAICNRENNDNFLLYGSAAPLNYKMDELEDEVVKINETTSMKIYQTTINSGEFQSFKNELLAGKIKLNSIFNKSCINEINIDACRAILQPSYGHSRVATESFYTFPKIENIFEGQVKTAFTSILNTLHENLGFSFKKDYAKRLGCFEVHNLHSWLEGSTPFVIRKTDDQIIIIERTEALTKHKHTIHLICKIDDDEIFNKLIDLPENKNHLSLNIPNEFFHLEAWIFDESGEVIHHEKYPYIREFNMAMGIQGHTTKIDDKLSRKSLNNKISNIPRVTTEISKISYSNNNHIEKHYKMMKRISSSCFPSNVKDKWFTKSLDNEIGVISHFKKIIDNGRVSKAIIIDPFFSDESLYRLIARISNITLNIRVVTSWAKIDPDTGELFTKDISPSEKLKNALNEIKHILNPELHVTNLTWKNDQAFHDRYLIIYPLEGVPEVYLLSNSINNMSGKWPFCMSLLSPSVSEDVILYAESLCQGDDSTRDGKPEITLEWSSKTK